MPLHNEVEDLKRLLFTYLEAMLKDYALNAAQIIASQSTR
jgi:hypothetical protein